MIETVVSAPIPGAGRVLDVTYPIPEFKVTGVNVDPPGDVLSRQGTVTNSGYVNVLGSGVNPTPRGPAVYGGRCCWKLTADAGSASVASITQLLQFHANTVAGGGNFQGDFSCWRVLVFLAFGASPALADFGLEMTMESGAGDMISAGRRGFALMPNGAGQIRFQARASAGAPFDPLSIDDPMPIVIDTTEYNAYEFRLVGANVNSPGFVRVLVNGNQQAVYSFANPLMPTGAVLRANICNRGGTQLYIPFNGLRISAGPTEQATL